MFKGIRETLKRPLSTALGTVSGHNKPTTPAPAQNGPSLGRPPQLSTEAAGARPRIPFSARMSNSVEPTHTMAAGAQQVATSLHKMAELQGRTGGTRDRLGHRMDRMAVKLETTAHRLNGDKPAAEALSPATNARLDRVESYYAAGKNVGNHVHGMVSKVAPGISNPVADLAAVAAGKIKSKLER